MVGQHTGVFRRFAVERYGGKAGDEHDLEVGIELAGALGQLDAVHQRHHNVGEQERERLLAELLVGILAIGERRNVVAGSGQRALQEPAHGLVVLRQDDALRDLM